MVDLKNNPHRSEKSLSFQYGYNTKCFGKKKMRLGDCHITWFQGQEILTSSWRLS